jgi:signal peptidase I
MNPPTSLLPPVVAPDAAPAEAPAEPTAASRRGWSWLRVIGAAFLAALLLRACAFEAYRIPSSSMEGTLLVGDFLIVSKLHYGARTPVTLGVPFTDRYLRDLTLPSTRLPGFSEVARGDVVVFNFPPETGPVDRKEHYVKRVVGLPGDTVRVVAKRAVASGAVLWLPPEARQLWLVRLASDSVAAEGVLPAEAIRGQPSFDEPEWLVEATVAEAEGLRHRPAVAAVAPYVRPPGDGSAAFPAGRDYTLDDYGPVVVPRRGLTVALDDATWPLYRDAITRYEGVPAQRVAGGFEIGGALTDGYTFRQDYYFVMGDNRDDSADSRTWGFVPADHLVGKAVLVYFSWDAGAGAPRWGRMFRRVE